MMKKCVAAITIIAVTTIVCVISLLLLFLFCSQEIKWQLMTLSEGVALSIILIDIIWLMKITEKEKLLVE